MKEKVSSLLNSVHSEGKVALAKVDSALQSTKDSILDSIDDGVSSVKKTYGRVTETLETFVAVGATVALIVAPVPTAVALAMMWFMEKSIIAQNSKIDSVTAMKKNDREFKRVSGLLKKHGIIPQTAIVETEHLRLEIDAERNTISGVVLKGPNTGLYLNDMDDQTLDVFRNSSPDEDTRQLMEGYMSFINTAKK